MHLKFQFWLLSISAGLMFLIISAGLVILALAIPELSRSIAWNSHSQQVIRAYNDYRAYSAQANTDFMYRHEAAENRGKTLETLDALQKLVGDNPTQFINVAEIKDAAVFRFLALDNNANLADSADQMSKANAKFIDVESTISADRFADMLSKMWRIVVTLLVLGTVLLGAFACAMYSTYQNLKLRRAVADKMREAFPQKNGIQDLIDRLDGAINS